jgi:hypothetical protein
MRSFFSAQQTNAPSLPYASERAFTIPRPAPETIIVLPVNFVVKFLIPYRANTVFNVHWIYLMIKINNVYANLYKFSRERILGSAHPKR